MTETEIMALLIREAYLGAVVRVVVCALLVLAGWQLTKVSKDLSSEYSDNKQAQIAVVVVGVWLAIGALFLWLLISAVGLLINPEVHVLERLRIAMSFSDAEITKANTPQLIRWLVWLQGRNKASDAPTIKRIDAELEERLGKGWQRNKS